MIFMATSIPTFRLELSEGLVDINTSADRLFGYCIEATKGPVMEPVYVASNAEAERIFGVDFAPHFYQKPTGLVLCRVGFEGMRKSSITYQVLKSNTEGSTDKVDAVKISAQTEGQAAYKVNISQSLTSTKSYNLTITVDGVTSKKYQSLPNLKSVVKRINNKFGQYLHAELLLDDLSPSKIDVEKISADECLWRNPTTNEVQVKTIASLATEQKANIIIEGGLTASRLVVNKDSSNNIIDTLSGGSNGKLLTTTGAVSNMEIPSTGLKEGMEGTGTEDNDPNVSTTLLSAYRKAFEKMKGVDLIGIATLSRSEVVQNELIEHINEVNDPEVAQLRFGITGFLEYPEEGENTTIDIDTIAEKPVFIDNEMIIYIGQGVIFEKDGIQKTLYPYEAVQLYTGLRSALGYSEAIFGGESKKVLKGVKDVLPLTTDGTIIVKEDREQLNESGVVTFKKEYDEVTFLEGLTTIQDHDVLSYESIMSIAVYVTKRLIRIAKPYQGQPLNEDLKATLTQALSTELQNITDTDKTLIAIDEYNIPPYDVEVKSAAMIAFNDANEVVRESKIIITCKIVPVGALRDIDLGVIII